MGKVFLSFSSQDDQLATFVAGELTNHGIAVFKAPLSIAPGESWSKAITENLRSSEWVVVLMSQRAASSKWVNQEIGAAHVGGKKLVPVVWDMEPSELPGWLRDYQAMDLRGKNWEQVRAEVLSIAKRIKSDDLTGLLLFAAVIGGLIYAGRNSS
jgi:hypothetical protein